MQTKKDPEIEYRQQVLHLLAACGYLSEPWRVEIALEECNREFVTIRASEPRAYDVSIRFSRFNREIIGIDSAVEQRSHSDAFLLGFASPVVSCNDDARVTWTMERRESATSASLKTDPRQLVAVVSRIRDLHLSQLRPLGVWEERFGSEFLLRRFAAMGIEVPADLASAIAELSDCPVYREGGREYFPCNHSLTPGNIAWMRRRAGVESRGIRFLNWERCALGDPLFELAMFGIECELSSDQWEILADTYFATVTSSERQLLKSARSKYYIWRALQALFESSLGLISVSDCTESLTLNRLHLARERRQ